MHPPCSTRTPTLHRHPAAKPPIVPYLRLVRTPIRTLIVIINDSISLLLNECFLLVIIIIITCNTHNTHAHGQCPHHTRARRTKDGRSAGTVIACIETVPAYTPHPSVIRTYTRRKPRRWLAILLMIGALSTRHTAMAYIPGVRLICRWLLFTSFCPSAVQPLERRGRSDNTTPTASYTVVS